jgi:small subunit ribosomal protein S17
MATTQKSAAPAKAKAPKAAKPAKAAKVAAAPVASVDERGARRLMVGRVVNDTESPGRTQKTIVVEVIRRYRDPVYGKYVKQRAKYHAHDEKHEFKTRDLVEIRESRPLSKTKRWVAIRLVDRPEEV